MHWTELCMTPKTPRKWILIICAIKFLVLTFRAKYLLFQTVALFLHLLNVNQRHFEFQQSNNRKSRLFVLWKKTYKVRNILLQGNQARLAPTSRFRALPVLRETKELLVGLEPRVPKEPKVKRDKMELDSLEWSMFAGEGPHVQVALR